jgi:bifunctional DNA-binding transcriptional regulator/antitoxin component of YhaV-PrlF toxin-antitoxin module
MGTLLGKPRPLDSRNRVTLPPEVLDCLKLKPNDEIFFRLDDGKIIIGKALIKYELIDEILGGKKK